ncbi:MAG: permease prefix domain 1-containing protein [Candidatus Acidiferrales bacterium]
MRGGNAAYLEIMTEENARSGLSPQEARYAALRSFGRASGVHARG